jgi:Flp pilus assembly protein TadD
LETRQPVKALEHYDLILAAFPRDGRGMAGWCDAINALDEKDLPLLMAQSQRSDLNVVQLLTLGGKLRALGQLEAAVTLAERAEPLAPRHFEVQVFLGYAYSSLPAVKDLGKAVAHYERALAISPGALGVMKPLAACYEAVGERARARRLYEQVLQLDPENAEAKEGISRLGPASPGE